MSANHADPQRVTAEYSLASAYQRFAVADWEGAAQICRAILEHDNNNCDALHLLGIIALQKKESAQAIVCLQQAAALRPEDAGIACNLGLALLEEGKIAEAVAAFQHATRINPVLADAWYNLAGAYGMQKKSDKAIAAYRQVLSLNANMPEAWNNLGNLLLAKGETDAALECFQRCLAIAPHFTVAWCNMAGVLAEKGQLAEAENALKQALRLQPGNANVLMRLGCLAMEQGQPEQGLAYFNHAARIAATDPTIHFNLGHAWLRMRQATQAAVAFSQAIAFKPDFAEAHNDLGACLLDMAEVEKALAHFQRAAELQPHDASLASNILLARHYREHDAQELYQAHCQWAERFARPVAASNPGERLAKNRLRLRLGYLSPDFRQHPVGLFIAPVIAGHDRERFEVVCFSNSRESDPLTARIRSACAEWHEICAMNDEQAAALIRQCGIDILVDLAGHTRGNRLGIFARKPAPVQITYLGYPNTTGLQAMDWRITDAYADPLGMTEHLHSERLLRLAPCFLCYVPLPDAPEVAPAPALARGAITFGSFNNPCKISPACVALWAKILHAVPQARLVLKSSRAAAPEISAIFRRRFAAYDIAAERLEFFGNQPDIRDHLAAYAEIDIALDTYPYHGTTTTCEALWMGVPVISLAGHSHVSRVGVSILHAAGLPGFIAETPEQYCAIAINLANDIPSLCAWRARMREHLRKSALTDIKAFLNYLERVYWQLCFGA